MSNDINYRAIRGAGDIGRYALVRLFHTGDGWGIDAQEETGAASEATWFFRTLDDALYALPILWGVLVYGIDIRISPQPSRADQAQAPAKWVVRIPIEGDGSEMTLHDTVQQAEGFVVRWLEGRV